MPCYHPLPAWRDQHGAIHLNKEHPDTTTLLLPCGGCLGCRMAHAKAWAFRCQLELQRHDTATFTTLTYSDENLPPTLTKRHLQLYLKRLRKTTAQPIRFFASGEYGERTQRPHYHAILYGVGPEEPALDRCWGHGHTRSLSVTAAAIAYVAGYTSKKIGYRLNEEERVDPETGEVYTWQPPFIQMSRRPGIGGHARAPSGMGPHPLDTWTATLSSWKYYAVQDGHKFSTPRFYREAWKKTATKEDIEQTELDKIKYAILRAGTTQLQREAQEKIALARQRHTAERRTLNE